MPHGALRAVRDGGARRGQRGRHRRRHRSHGRPRGRRRRRRRGRRVSANRLELHKAVDGREVPGTFATADELTALIRAAGKGSADAVVQHDHARRRRAATARCGTARSTCSRPRRARAGVAITFAFGGSSGSDWRDRLARMERENADGARIVPQVSSHGQGLFCGLRTSHPFRGRPSYDAIEHLPVAERAARMAEPDVARRDPGRASRTRRAAPARPDAGQADAVFPSHLVPDLRARSVDQPRRAVGGAGPRPGGAPLRVDHRRRRRRARALLPRWLRREPRRARRAARAPGDRARPRRRRRPRRPHLRRRLPVVPPLLLGA